MAEHTARRFAVDGARLALAARDQEKLNTLAADLRVRGAAEVIALPKFDAGEPDNGSLAVEAAFKALETVDIVLIAHGSLPEQKCCEADAEVAAREIETNFTSVVRLCTDLANRLSGQTRPATLAVISSVAGLRGRQSNYVYGAAKGGLNVFLQGLRNRLHPEGVRVVTLLPGFVDTPMTAEITKGPLFVSAEKAGTLIHKALTQSRADIVYVPFFWRLILWVIRAIPETVFKRLKL